MSIHLPSLTDAGHDAHQIRRAIERSYTDAENARLRALRRGWPDIAAGLQEVLIRLEILRTCAEEHRRIHTPPQYRTGGAAGATERAAEAAETTEGA